MGIENEIDAGWSAEQADCRLVFEGNAHPMWVFAARGIVDVNRAALLRYDLSRDEFLSMSAEEFEPTGAELSSFAITFGGMPATLRSASDVTSRRRIAAETFCLERLLSKALNPLGASDDRCFVAGLWASAPSNRAAAEDIRALLANVIAAQEGERRRVARALDDETAQTLVSVLVGLRTVEEAADARGARESVGVLRTSVAAVLRAIGRIASDLRPSLLDHLGLEPALQHLALDMSRRSAFFVDFQMAGAPVRLPESTEVALYRIAQEALINASKHAAAKIVSIFLQRNDGAVRLFIEDDGIGFALAARPSRTQLGIMGMRERASLIGGSMTVRSSVGHGTTLCVSAPVPTAAAMSAGLLS